jgi:hypothetical protein
MGAMRKITDDAGNAVVSDWMMAKENNDIDGAMAATAFAAESGLLPVHKITAMEIDAENEITARQNRDAELYADEAVKNGDAGLAIEIIQNSNKTDAEKAAEIAHLKNRSLVIQSEKEVLDYAANHGADEASRKLSDPKNWPDLTGDNRKTVMTRVAQESNAMEAATFEELQDEVRLGNFANTVELASDPRFVSLNATDREKLSQSLGKEASNDIAEFLTLSNTLSGYDPKTDPRGAVEKEYRKLIASGFTGERAEELHTILQDRLSPDAAPLEASERVLGDVMSAMTERFKAGDLGNYRISGDKIKAVEEGGVTTYYRIDKNPLIGRTVLGDEVVLSEEEKARFDAGKTGVTDIYEDKTAKEKAGATLRAMKDHLERKRNSGEAVTANDFTKEIESLVEGFGVGSADKDIFDDDIGEDSEYDYFGPVISPEDGGVDAGLFPSRTKNLEQQAKELFNATGY